MYVCGVTPYDTTHLGHARTFLVFDVLARLLETRGQRLRYAQNVTDIDESILQRAARDKVSWRDLGRREERGFLQDMRRLDWRKPDAIPHATREMPAMIKLAERLKRMGHAYEVPGGLYFDVATFPRFGQLSRFSPRIASSTAHSWYGAVGAAAIRRRTARTSSGSVERGTAREDIVHRRCYGSTTRGGAAPSHSRPDLVPRRCTSAA